MREILKKLGAKLLLAVGVPVTVTVAGIVLFSDDVSNNKTEEYTQEDISYDTKVEIESELMTINSETEIVTISQGNEIQNSTNQTTTDGEPSSTNSKNEEENLPEQTDSVPIIEETTGEYSIIYTYDLLGRISRVEYEKYILEYLYDNNGNILKIEKYSK